MNTEIYIENHRLDVSSGISALITYELDNIKDFASRSTTWSKTIVLPGTANNNKLFGNIFQIGQSNFYSSLLPNVNYNFNASKSADCIIFQDQLQTFRGVLRLLQINITKGRPEYEVAVFGKLASLNVALGAGFLEDLDFSAYNHVYNATNIIASWDNVAGTGVYYPLIDYGTYSAAKHNWDIRTFRPALYAREYIDKMFTAAGYRFVSDLMDTDRFKRLVIPHNQKQLTSIETLLLDVSDSGERTLSTHVIFDILTELGLFTAGGGNTEFTYGGASQTVSGTLDVDLEGSYYSELESIYFYIKINGVTVTTLSLDPTNNSIETPYAYTDQGVVGLVFSPGDILSIELGLPVFGAYSIKTTFAHMSFTADSGQTVPISPGDTVKMNEALPKNIRQIDFLVGIVKLFNLYVYEDRFDPTIINITPYVDFYNAASSDSIDWTYKVNRDKVISIKPMSELNARKYEFKYKPDSDYYNEIYRKRYNQGYGDHVFDSQYEFAEQSSGIEIIFSATPLVGYNGEEKVYSTIFKRTGPDSTAIEELTDSNIRILQSAKVIGVTSWNILDGVGVLASTTNYGYAGHLNDPDAPSNDINFGVLRELFFALVSGDLSVNQFNVYWSGYMSEITDKDSKLVTCYVYLNPKDILLLDFSKKIFIDGVLFRLNSIKDYNASSPSDCPVELLKINYLNYSGEIPADDTGFLLWDTGQFLLDSDSGKIKYL
jgi:hypothetical protein